MPHAMTASRHIFCLATLYVCVACGAAPGESASRQATTHTAREVKRSPSSHDWTRFGWDVGRSSVATDPTGISPENVATLRSRRIVEAMLAVDEAGGSLGFEEVYARLEPGVEDLLAIFAVIRDQLGDGGWLATLGVGCGGKQQK